MLKDTCCSMNRSDCAGCPLEAVCIYSVIFESVRTRDEYGIHRPHPMTLRIPRGTPTTVHEGAKLTFEILLLGKYCADIPYIVAAIEKLGESGLGEGRVRYQLMAVTPSNSDRSIYWNGEMLKTNLPAPEVISVGGNTRPESVCIRIISPVRMKLNGQIKNIFSPEEFLSLIRTRLFTLNREYGESERYPDLKSIDGIKVVSNDTCWFDQTRHSGRNRYRKIKYGGLIGEVILTNLSNDAWSLLKAGEIIQVGKGTSLGMGLYKLVPV